MAEDKYQKNRQLAYDLLKKEGYTDIGDSAEKLFENRSNGELAFNLLKKAGYNDLGDDYNSLFYGNDGGGAKKPSPQPITANAGDNSQWAVTPSPYWNGPAKQEQQATAPAEPAPAPAPEPTPAPTPAQQEATPAPAQEAEVQGRIRSHTGVDLRKRPRSCRRSWRRSR